MLKQEIGLNLLEKYPKAERLGLLNSHLARQAGDLHLHSVDLLWCCEILQCIGSVFKDVNRETNRQHYQVLQSSWHGVLIRFYKCFESSARIKLSEDKIFKDLEAARVHFNFFRDFRNKHVAHDENSLTQVLVVAVINKKDTTENIPNTYNVKILSETFLDSWLESMWQIANHTLKWVEKELQEKNLLLLQEVRRLSREQLEALPEPQYTAPDNSKIGHDRI